MCKRYQALQCLLKHIYTSRASSQHANHESARRFDVFSSLSSVINTVKICNTDLQNPEHLKHRPIVASCNSPTQCLSALLEKLLTPIAQTAKTYIKDNWHFLRYISTTLQYDKITLFSVDLTSLYQYHQ